MKKSLLFFFVLVIGYEVLIRSIDVWWTMGQNQWHANRIVADNFLYRVEQYPNVMVGSSLASRLRSRIAKDSLPVQMYNLALSGRSLFDGLLILKQSGYIPRNLYIETNVLDRNEDKGLQKAIFSPVMANIKAYLKSWRDNYQPVEVLFRFRPTRPSGAELLMHKHPARDEKSYQTLLALQVEKNRLLLDETFLRGQTSKLRDLVLYFQNKGAHVTFFEMPMDSALCSTGRVVQIRDAIRKTFVPMNCDFIEVPSCYGFVTTDGVHLEVPSVYKYLHYFRNAINKRS